MKRRKRRGILLTAGVILVAFSSLAGAQTPGPKPTQPIGQDKRPPLTDIPGIALTNLSEQCQHMRERAAVLRSELEASLSQQVKAAVESYAAKPGPGVSPEKAWGDYAAAASLTGDTNVAAWAGLKAAEIRWSGEDHKRGRLSLPFGQDTGCFAVPELRLRNGLPLAVSPRSTCCRASG